MLSYFNLNRDWSPVELGSLIVKILPLMAMIMFLCYLSIPSQQESRRLSPYRTAESRSLGTPFDLCCCG
jgi:hypothetical protein